MSFGKMSTFVDVIKPTITKDSEGFAVSQDVILASIRAYYEPKHGSEKWASRTEIFEATAMFQFRAIPNTKITTDMVLVCKYGRFEITSVEDVKGRGMYLEVMAKVVE